MAVTMKLKIKIQNVKYNMRNGIFRMVWSQYYYEVISLERAS